jgi:hypothetical protein
VGELREQAAAAREVLTEVQQARAETAQDQAKRELLVAEIQALKRERETVTSAIDDLNAQYGRLRAKTIAATKRLTELLQAVEHHSRSQRRQNPPPESPETSSP